MKKLTAAIIFFLLLFPVWADTGSHSFSSTLEILGKYYPADENSENEHAVTDYIQKTLQEAGITFTEVPLNTLPDRHSFSRNIYARIPGTSENHLIIAAPLNGEKGNEVNVAAALELARIFKASDTGRDVRILFLGAETGKTEGHPIGTNVFIKNSYTEKSSVIYLNFASLPDTVILKTGNHNSVTPYSMARNINRALIKSELKYNLRSEQNMLYNIGMISPPSPLDPYLDAEIPAVMLYSNSHEALTYNTDLWFDRLSACITEFADISAGSWENTGKNYLTVRLTDSYAIISELYLLFFFLAVSVIIIFYITFHAKQSANYIKRIFKYFHLIPWTAFTVFIFYVVSTYITVGILRLTHLESQWQKIIPEIFILKCTVCTLMLIATVPFFKKLKRPNMGSFYSGSAVVTAIVDLILFIIIDFSFAVYFIWGLLWIFVFTLYSSRRIKFLCMILAGTFLFMATHGIIFYPAMNLAEDLIFSSFKINLFIAMISLPFVFMGARIFYVLPPKFKFRHKLSRVSALLGIIVITVFSVRFIYTYSPFSRDNLQVVKAEQILDADGKTSVVHLESNYKIGDIRLDYEDEHFEISTDKKWASVNTARPKIKASFEKETDYFLERKTVRLKIDAEGKANKLLVYLIPKNKDDRLLILDSTYPHMDENGNVRFRIGQNQPMPFEMEITTPRDEEFSTEILVIYSEPPFRFSFEGENKTCVPYFTLKKNLP